MADFSKHCAKATEALLAAIETMGDMEEQEEKDFIASIRPLVEKADVNAQTSLQKPMLQKALDTHNLGAAKLLLDHGADLRIVFDSVDASTLSAVITHECDKDVIELLQSYIKDTKGNSSTFLRLT